MKKVLLIILAVLPYAFTHAQSANLDRERFNVSYVSLPSNPILDDKARTYDINVINAMRSSSRGKITKNKINISGFSKVDTNGTLGLNIDISDVEFGDVSIEKTETQNKDKDGKVTSVTRTYYVLLPYKTYASMKISNAVDGSSVTRTFGGNETYKSNSYNTYSKAKEHYNNNRGNLKNRFRSEFFKNALNGMNNYLNRSHGYRPYTSGNEYFWILASKKHPEKIKHHEAFETLKTAFAEMKHDLPVDDIAKQAIPAIEYFNDVITRYPGKDRKSRKVRYASYYNIAKIYLYLDNPEKAKEYAQKLIDNNHSKSDGKSMIKSADRLRERLDKNKMTSRHFEVVTEDLTNSEAVNEEEITQEAPAEEDTVAFLITKDNDTIAAKIAASEINNITYSAKLKVTDKDGNEGETIYKAKNASAIALTNGDVYEVVYFKESSLKEDAVDLAKSIGLASGKFAKVLHKSEKIELYLFAGKELVIKKPGDKKGKSTLSTGFLFAFKKKLAGMVEDCPELVARAKDKEFKNTPESLIKFCEAYDACGKGTK